MILLPIVLLGILPGCLYALSVHDPVPTFQNAAVVNRHGNGSHLNTLPQAQRQLFDYAMEGLDAYFKPPFLVSSSLSQTMYMGWTIRYSFNLLGTRPGMLLPCLLGTKATTSRLLPH